MFLRVAVWVSHELLSKKYFSNRKDISITLLAESNKINRSNEVIYDKHYTYLNYLVVGY